VRLEKSIGSVNFVKASLNARGSAAEAPEWREVKMTGIVVSECSLHDAQEWPMM
jgi:hypothetical protein